MKASEYKVDLGRDYNPTIKAWIESSIRDTADFVQRIKPVHNTRKEGDTVYIDNVSSDFFCAAPKGMQAKVQGDKIWARFGNGEWENWEVFDWEVIHE